LAIGKHLFNIPSYERQQALT